MDRERIVLRLDARHAGHCSVSSEDVRILGTSPNPVQSGDLARSGFLGFLSVGTAAPGGLFIWPHFVCFRRPREVAGPVMLVWALDEVFTGYCGGPPVPAPEHPPGPARPIRP